MYENHERASRSARHQKKATKSHWKIIMALLIVLAVVLAGSYLKVQQVEIRRQKAARLTEQETVTLQKIQSQQDRSKIAFAKQISKEKQATTIFYTPKDIKLPEDVSEAQLKELVASEQERLKTSKPTILVGQVNVAKIAEHLESFALNVANYQWNGNKEVFEKADEQNTAPIYTNTETGEKITGKMVIESQENLLGIQQVIQQKILDQSKAPDKIIDAVLDMPRISFDNEMVYSPKSLHIKLPKNDTGVADIDLNYNDIRHFIKNDLIDPSALKADEDALDENGKYIALTFDDGPSPTTTPRLLDILRDKQVHATFFMLGQNAQEAPDVVKRVHEEGHEIASHSYSHPQLTALSSEELQKEMHDADKAIFEASGVLPKDVRPPYGAIDTKSAEIIGRPIIQWNIDSLDWKTKNTQAVIDRVNQTAQDGGIILMHDIHPTTVDAVGTVIDNLRNQGYQIVSVSQMLGDKAKPLNQYFGQTDHRKV